MDWANASAEVLKWSAITYVGAATVYYGYKLFHPSSNKAKGNAKNAAKKSQNCNQQPAAGPR